MTFKSVLDIDCGIRFMYEDLELNSSCARKMLLESEMMTSKREIDVYYGKLNELYTKDFKAISLKLMCLKDIHTTIKRLGAGVVLDDIELFEIKYLAMISQDVRKLLLEQRITAVNLPDLKKVVEILDPDSLNIPSFYVYDSYSEQLAYIRKEMRNISGYGKEIGEQEREQLLELQRLNDEQEFQIRENLVGKLLEYAAKLEHVLKSLSLLDIMIAKCVQMKRLGLCFPSVAEGVETFGLSGKSSSRQPLKVKVLPS